MKQLKIWGLIGLAVAAGSLAYGQQQQPLDLPRHVTGKVVAVSHQKVKVGNDVLDKIDVTIDSCLVPGQLVTVQYAAATDSDRTALGHLFDEDVHSARTADMKQQQIPNGYGLFWVDENNRVLRTGILGAKVDCNQAPALLKQF